MPSLLEQARLYRRERNPAAAIDLYRQLLALAPNSPDLLFEFALALHEANDLPQAAQILRQAIALQPSRPDFHDALGLLLFQQRDPQAAQTAHQIALNLNPNFAPAHCNLAFALRALGHLDQAAQHAIRAAQLRPDVATPRALLARIFYQKQLPAEAKREAETAIQLDPTLPEPHALLANLHVDEGLIESAVDQFQIAHQLNPANAQAHSDYLFGLHFDPRATPSFILKAHQHYATLHEKPHVYPFPHPNDPHRVLRVGYVSPDLGDHVVGLNFLPIMTHHDPSQVETFCYATLDRTDATRDKLRAASHHWNVCVNFTDAQLFDQIRADQIDVLVDMALHMSHSRLTLFALKPAPVQFTHFGYPATTGLSNVDYRVSDPHVEPPDQVPTFSSEKIAHLPDSFWCFTPSEHTPDVTPLPSLSTGVFTFSCLNAICKINPNVVHLWARILKQIPNSRLLLLKGRHNRDPHPYLQQILSQNGVSPTRITYLPMAASKNYLAYYNQSDLGLDPFPYTGHSTSLDSFYMGVPVITLPGATSVSRAGLSILNNLNLPEFIAQSPDQYVQCALHWASHPAELNAIRQSLRNKMKSSSIMNAKAYTQSLESLYRNAWIHYVNSPRP